MDDEKRRLLKSMKNTWIKRTEEKLSNYEIIDMISMWGMGNFKAAFKYAGDSGLIKMVEDTGTPLTYWVMTEKFKNLDLETPATQ